MKLVRAYYIKSNNTSRCGHLRHACDQADKPACGMDKRTGYNEHRPSGWRYEQGEPTCPVCLRRLQRQVIAGGTV